MLLEHMTSVEVENYLKRSKAIIIPIGATEQHGLNGLIGTDAICAEIVARQVGKGLDAIVAPTIAIGMSQFQLGFAGSLTLRPSTLQAVVIDIVKSLSRHGFNRIYFLNGHGGNIAPVSTAFQEFFAEESLSPKPTNRPSTQLRLRNWWQGSRTRLLIDDLYGAAEGYHATASEIAITLHLFSELVKGFDKSTDHKPRDILEIDHGADQYNDADDFRKRYPDGTVGSEPSLSTAEAGKRILTAAIDDIVDDFSKFVETH